MSSRLVLGGLVLAFVVAGCGGQPEPRIAAPTASEASTSVTPTESAELVVETPRLFIRRWFSVADAMLRSGDTQVFESLNLNCDPCSEYARTARETYAAGGSISAGTTRVVRVRPAGRDGDLAAFDVAVESQPSTIRRSAAAPAESFPGGGVTYRVTLTRSTSGWTMQNYAIREQDLTQ